MHAPCASSPPASPAAQALCEFGGRYSVLASLHANALSRFAVRTGASFPPKAPLQNMVGNAQNVARRAAELAAYFTRLLAFPNTGNAELLAILSVPPAAQQQLQQLAGQQQAQIEAAAAAQRAAAEAAARAAAEAAARAAAEATADVAQAQAANHLSAFAGSVGAGAPPSLTYPKPMRFMLRTKVWSSDIRVKGPGPGDGFDYFLFRRSDLGAFASLLRNASFTLCTLSGEPLLVMQEHFSWLSYVYVIHRYVPATNALVELATVRGVHSMGGDAYEVSMAPALAASTRIACAGQWPNRAVLTQLSGGAAVEAAVVERVMFCAAETYKLSLAPGADVLLYLGIAAAIDRIHHEIEEKHRRAPPPPAVGLGLGVGIAAAVLAAEAAHHPHGHRPPHFRHPSPPRHHHPPPHHGGGGHHGRGGGHHGGGHHGRR